MAEKNISSWEEFVTALTETVTENTTYNLQNDIDISDTIIENQIVLTSTGSYRKTINGNDHKINGITCYFSGSVFATIINSSNSYTFNKIHFTNLMMQSAKLFALHTYSVSSAIYFNDCFFNGLVDSLFGGGFSSSSPTTNAYINRCSCNVKCNTLFSASYIINNSYFIVDKFNTLCNLIGYNGSLSATDSYFGGKLHINYGTTTYIYGRNTGGTHNVFNCDVTILNYSSSTTYYTTGSNNTTSTTCLYNKDKIHNSAGDTITTTARVEFIGLTDSQLKSKDYIQNNTLFPLYG